MLIFSFDRYMISKPNIGLCDPNYNRTTILGDYFTVGKFIKENEGEYDDIQSVSFEIPYYPQQIKIQVYKPFIGV